MTGKDSAAAPDEHDANAERVWLYLGSGQDASNLSQLQAHGVTHIMNVADDVPNFHEGLFEYINLRVGDFGSDEGISRVFGQAIEVASECRSKGSVLLIHCANGSNRSATVAIAVLVAVYSLSLRQAFRLVKLKHNATMPLRDNRHELMRWEMRHLNIECSTMADIDFDRTH
jgi:protein-tyrosine phosphatase